MARPAVPPKVPRSLAPSRDEAVEVILVKEEIESSVSGAVSLASLRKSVPSQDNMVATTAGSENVKPPLGDASP